MMDIQYTRRYSREKQAWAMLNECKNGHQSSSKLDTEWLRYGYRIGPKGNQKSPLSEPNSLPTGIPRGTQGKDQEMITEISKRRISLPKVFTGRLRGLPEDLPYQATDWDP